MSRNKRSDLTFEWKGSVKCFVDNNRWVKIDCNVSAMISTGLKVTNLSIKQLAKTFYYVLSFLY